MSEFHARFQDILPASSTGVPITVVGAGGLGSPIVLALAKMGFDQITVYDHDHVDTVNIGCQLYRPADVDKPKVAALAEIVKDFTDVDITVHHRKWTEADRTSGILIAAVDCMNVRAQLFDAHRLYPQLDLFIDVRMGAEDAQLYGLVPAVRADQELWDGFWYPSDKVEPAPCTAKATFYTGIMIAGLVTKTVKDHVMNKPRARRAVWSIGDGEYVQWAEGRE